MQMPGKYPGSKMRLMRLIDGALPPHRHLVIVFGGMGGELFGHEPDGALETMNDLNFDNWNAMTHLQKHCESLIKYLETCWYSERLFRDCQQMLMTGAGTAFQRACSWWVVANMSIGTSDPTCVRQTFSVTRRDRKNLRAWGRIDEIFRIASLRMRQVQIINRSWEYAFEKFDAPDTLFLCDPPYIGLRNYYRYTMTDDDHRRFAMRLSAIRGKAIVWNVPNLLYSGVLSKWESLMLSRRGGLGLHGVRDVVRKQQLWANFPILAGLQTS